MFKYLRIDLQALLRIFLCGALLSAVGAALIYFTPLGEKRTVLLGTLILAYSVYRGGQYAASCIHRNGLLHGLRVGVLFFVLITIAHFIFLRTPLVFADFYPTLFLVLAASGIGGISGVNKQPKTFFKKRKAHRPVESNEFEG